MLASADAGLVRHLSERLVRNIMTLLPLPNTGAAVGSLDGNGAGDHDQPYRFGCRPRATATYPFNTRQYARLLVLRGRVQDDVGAPSELATWHGSDIRLESAA